MIILALDLSIILNIENSSPNISVLMPFNSWNFIPPGYPVYLYKNKLRNHNNGNILTLLLYFSLTNIVLLIQRPSHWQISRYSYKMQMLFSNTKPLQLMELHSTAHLILEGTLNDRNESKTQAWIDL